MWCSLPADDLLVRTAGDERAGSCGGRDATIAEVAGSGPRDAGRKPDTMPPAGDPGVVAG
jgi:hypothetical protein